MSVCCTGRLRRRCAPCLNTTQTQQHARGCLGRRGCLHPHTHTGRQPLTDSRVCVCVCACVVQQRQQQQQQQQQYGGVHEQDAAQPRLEPGPDGGARWTWDDCCSSLSHGLTHCAPSLNDNNEHTANTMGAAHWAAYAALLGGFPVRAPLNCARSFSPSLTAAAHWPAQRLRVPVCASCSNAVRSLGP